LCRKSSGSRGSTSTALHLRPFVFSFTVITSRCNVYVAEMKKKNSDNLAIAPKNLYFT
jgi:hypothetical protein